MCIPYIYSLELTRTYMFAMLFVAVVVCMWMGNGDFIWYSYQIRLHSACTFSILVRNRLPVTMYAPISSKGWSGWNCIYLVVSGQRNWSTNKLSDQTFSNLLFGLPSIIKKSYEKKALVQQIALLNNISFVWQNIIRIHLKCKKNNSPLFAPEHWNSPQFLTGSIKCKLIWILQHTLICHCCV